VARVSRRCGGEAARAADALGYPGPDPSARSLRYGATRNLGVVLGEHLTYAFDDPQAVRFLAGIAEVCAERGYGLLIVPTGTGDQDRDRVVAAAVDAYIVWTTTDDDPALVAACGTRRPVVVHEGPTGRARPLSASTIAGRPARWAARCSRPPGVLPC
jgi:DNA-binding LacI/PurR family transcriptional regulator